MMNLEEIKRILPHRYPMLLIDRVLELDPGSSCKAIKNVTANEQVFQGHFPQNGSHARSDDRGGYGAGWRNRYSLSNS